MDITLFEESSNDGLKPTPEGREMGRRILMAFREARLGDTQSEIARALKVSPMTVSYWIRGMKMPPIHTGVLLAKQCKVCVEWLYTGRGPMRPEPLPSHIEMASRLDEKPPRLREFVENLLEQDEKLWK